MEGNHLYYYYLIFVSFLMIFVDHYWIVIPKLISLLMILLVSIYDFELEFVSQQTILISK